MLEVIARLVVSSAASSCERCTSFATTSWRSIAAEIEPAAETRMRSRPRSRAWRSRSDRGAGSRGRARRRRAAGGESASTPCAARRAAVVRSAGTRSCCRRARRHRAASKRPGAKSSWASAAAGADVDQAPFGRDDRLGVQRVLLRPLTASALFRKAQTLSAPAAVISLSSARPYTSAWGRAGAAGAGGH